MSDLKKTFRYNKLTLLDMLTLLSKEYLNYSSAKITADILSNIVFKLSHSVSVDKYQSDDVKREIK